MDAHNIIAKNLVTKDGDISRFVGMKIHYQPRALLDGTLESDAPPPPVYLGVIEATFGKGGKFKVRFEKPAFDKGAQPDPGAYVLALHFQVNQFDKTKKMMQPPGLGPAVTA